MELVDWRCCMCPQAQSDSRICPKGPLKTEESPCRFVVAYTDKRGWKYQVMSGLGENKFKGRYQDDRHQGRTGWKCMRQLPWRDTFDAAQEDLNIYARGKGWSVYGNHE